MIISNSSLGTAELDTWGSNRDSGIAQWVQHQARNCESLNSNLHHSKPDPAANMSS